MPLRSTGFLLITFALLEGYACLREVMIWKNMMREVLTGTPLDKWKHECKSHAEASYGVLQTTASSLGEKILLGSMYVTTKAQAERAMKYTVNCTTPKIGPIPKMVALVKWNRDGNFVYPGTKWCGAGNVSTENDRYGPAQSTDKCCEKHDNATDYMLAEEKHPNNSLQNPHPYTVTNCSDDIKLFDCLYKDNTTASYEFGQAFFDAMHVPCFAFTYPFVCTSYKGGNCIQYDLNTTRGREWQFIPPPNFYNAFTKKWYPNDKVPAETADNTWRLACQKDDQMGCSQYDFVKKN